MNRKQHAPRRWISSTIFLCKEEHVIVESLHAHCRRNPSAMPLILGRAGRNSSPPEIKRWRSSLHTEGRGVHRRFFTLPLQPGCVWGVPPSGLPHSLFPSLSGLLGMLPSISPAPFLFFFLLMVVFIWFSLERVVEVLVFQILLDKGKLPLPDHPQRETLAEQIHLPLCHPAHSKRLTVNVCSSHARGLCYPSLQEAGSERGVGKGTSLVQDSRSGKMPQKALTVSFPNGYWNTISIMSQLRCLSTE